MYYRDPTGNSAIKNVDREWRRMATKAFLYRTDPEYAQKIKRPEAVFNGIYQRLLTDPLRELIYLLPINLLESAIMDYYEQL